MTSITLRDTTIKLINYSQQLEALKCVTRPFPQAAQLLYGKPSAHQVHGDSMTGIKLFTTDSNENKWYLRMSAFGGEADLVCPAHVNHVS